MMRRHSILLSGVLAAAPATALAQAIPPAATPGGSLPRVEPAVPAPENKGELLEIPKVHERPASADDAPRIVVKVFRLTGAADHLERDLRVGDAQAALDAALAGQPVTGFSIGQLQEIANSVATLYREHGYILTQAWLPRQDVVDGTVTIQVLEGQLSDIVVEGNSQYSTRTLERPFAALIGAPVERDSLEAALLTLRNYPGVTAFGVLGAGRESGSSQLTVRVQSEDRFVLDAALDNYGSQFAGEYRGQLIFTVNDPLGRADRLQLIGLYAIDPDDTGNTHGLYGGLDYEIPLFSPRDSLRFMHLTNAYNVGADAASVTSTDTEGETRVDEIGYRHDFPRTRLGSASVGLAFNVKSSEFRAPPAVLYEDKLTTVRLDAQWNRIDTRFRGSNSIAFSYTRGFKDLLDSLDDYRANTAGSASRFGASGEFDKLSLRVQRLQRVTQNASLMFRMDGQYSSDPLVSLEQFSLGGPDSVRAYSVSEELAEKGGVATLELALNAPGFANRPAFDGYSWGQVLQLSLFADYAYGEFNEPRIGSLQESVELSGVGIGVQFSAPGNFFLRADVATPLSNAEPGNGRDPQYYARFGASFR
ncbi:ShlB/FhaC/HecB family hemolysin secretion/activation protein [Steroidobacter flavus]|uniref:ShlB/FhaC/HecB family hemolysin secretion/activation protein n=1 Tax=Steroidobacter flavus TaxID=1842136 RepID=A0ABV8T1V4_9GAMM